MQWLFIKSSKQMLCVFCFYGNRGSSLSRVCKERVRFDCKKQWFFISECLVLDGNAGSFNAGCDLIGSYPNSPSHSPSPPLFSFQNGNTALAIARRLGYISVVDTLKVVTEEVITTTTVSISSRILSSSFWFTSDSVSLYLFLSVICFIYHFFCCSKCNSVLGLRSIILCKN